MKRAPKLILASLFFLLISVGSIFTPDSTAEVFSFCGPSGGIGGSTFSDSQTGGRRIAGVKVYSGQLIDSIQVIYIDKENKYVEGNKNGGSGGSLSVLTLAPDEYITQVAGKYGSYVDSLYIKTNKGQEKKWGGAGGKVVFYYSAPPGTQIFGFFGRSGKYLDSIGVIIMSTGQ